MLTCHRHEHRWIGQIALGQNGQDFVTDVGLIELFVDLLNAQNHLLLDLRESKKRKKKLKLNVCSVYGKMIFQRVAVLPWPYRGEKRDRKLN